MQGSAAAGAWTDGDTHLHDRRTDGQGKQGKLVVRKVVMSREGRDRVVFKPVEVWRKQKPGQMLH